MSVRREILEYDGIYFITITCSQWLHLFELSNGYEEVWNLVKEEVEYVHSSAKYYVTGEQGIYSITKYTELEDIDLTRA